MQTKLIVMVMGQNCEKFLPMCLESVKGADQIIYCDGAGNQQQNTSTDEAILSGANYCISNTYNQGDEKMNGKQRNFYLKHLKKNFPNDWALCLDADEVVEDINAIKKFIQLAPKGCYSVKMRHFHENLGHEDATQEQHFVPMRLFKISEAEEYLEVEHSVLQPAFKSDTPEDKDKLRGGNYVAQVLIKEGKYTTMGQTTCTTIWHLAHLEHCFSIKKRYEKNLIHSNMHSKEFLMQWYRAHLFGQYPIRQIDLTEIPNVILKYFHIDKDELYFKDRNVEVKHFIMIKNWIDYFKEKYNTVDYNPHLLEYGCGKAPYGFAAKIFGCDYKGVELSKHAVEKAFVPIEQGDITKWDDGKEYDICLAIDVLEHLDNNQLDKALENLYDKASLYIFSIPFIGDPNLFNDKTHLQFRTKEEWKELLSEKGFKISDAPTEWAFHNQILVGELK